MANIVEIAREVVETSLQYNICVRDLEKLKAATQQAAENRTSALNTLSDALGHIIQHAGVAEAILKAYEIGHQHRP